MKPVRLLLVTAISSWVGLPSQAALTPEQLQQLPPPASHTINFTKEIKPILEASCIKCHGRGRDKGDFRIDSRETLLKDGGSGPAIVVGKSAESYLIELVMGFNPDNVMPKKGTKLTREQVGLLRAWIDQGAAWDADVSFAKKAPTNLQTRRPELPAGRNQNAHPVDRLVEAYFAAHKIKSPKVVDDRVFARRVYLDVLGLLPPAEELEKFVADRSKDKRAQLVRRLLADNENYAIHWMTFWNDMLRNDYRGTGYIDGGRKQITQWLYAALKNNMPYDRFVTELIYPKPESEGFAKGIVWRGVVNASQTPQMQAAQNISQVFMGVNLKCASCHDSFINDWTLADAYGLAGIYSDGPLEMVLCDKPTGKNAPLRFIYPQLGEIDPQADKPARLKQLAQLVTQRRDGRLTRTFVNRLWQKFFGHGLVEPADDMETPAWNVDLLDWLAEDFADHGYDAKHTIELLLTSHAYQLPSVAATEQADKEFVFHGPIVRRMSAEQFRDALTTVTGIGYATPAADLPLEGGKTGAKPAKAPAVAPKWIWSEADAASKAKAGTVYLRKEFTLAELPTEAAVVVKCDNTFQLQVNGQRVGDGDDYTRSYVFDIRSRLKEGQNFIAVKAVNRLPNNTDPKDGEAVPGTENPAGLLFVARLRAGAVVLDFGSDDSWTWSSQAEDWNKPQVSAERWKGVAVLGDVTIAPWNVPATFAQQALARTGYGEVRAALVAADSLQVALGRPNREQVITVRASTATTLQALELTNGAELSRILGGGAEKILARQNGTSSNDLAKDLYQTALGRAPNSKELVAAREILGQPAQKAGVEDLMWVLAMLPEFQLIY
jgi:hypothetical protein